MNFLAPFEYAVAWVGGAVARARGRYVISYGEELPDVIPPRQLFIVGEEGHLWYGAFLCPCGCEAVIQASLLPQGRPRWTVQEHWDRTATLHPSINRVVGCRSHFWLRRGQIQWCDRQHPTSVG